jgi:hypothetical protein
MSTPTVALTRQITIAGETRTLKYGLLALHDLGLNPFDPKSIETFNARKLDIRELAALVRAGLRHEYNGSKAPRRGQPEPSVDDLLADMDDDFVSVAQSIFELLGSDVAGTDTEAPKQDPPTA